MHGNLGFNIILASYHLFISQLGQISLNSLHFRGGLQHKVSGYMPAYGLVLNVAQF